MQETVLHVTYSQDLEVLSETLIEALFSKGASAFTSRLVVVPHLLMKDFLMNRLAHHPKLRIATGLQILPLHQAVMEIVDRSDEVSPSKKIPSLLELTMLIQEELLKETRAPELQGYLGTSSQRVAALSSELAKLFTRYGLFGEQFLPFWLNQEGWQQDLWKQVFGAKSSFAISPNKYTYPLAFLSDLKELSFEGQIVLFGFSYLPFAQLRFFASLGASCYFFSPCAYFWEDLVSDQERIQLDRFAKKQGVSLSTREQLLDYMKNSHPLLAGWGKMGKQMVKGLQRVKIEEEERYVVPSSSRLLASLQRSILTLEVIEELDASEKTGRFDDQSWQEDDSIQIHSAPSRLREVEALKDTLETVLEKHQREGQPILPGDVLVLAPDLSLYRPLIEQVFKTSVLPFVMGTKAALDKEVESFFLFLELPKQRYSLKAVGQLLEYIEGIALSSRTWGKKSFFSSDDLQQLLSWFKQAQIRFDLSGHQHSWQEGLDRLLYGLSFGSFAPEGLDPWPVPCVPQSEVELLNRFMVWFFDLQQALFHLEQKRPLLGWLTLLFEWKERFICDEEIAIFFSELRSLQKNAATSQEALWNFEDVYALLSTLAEQQKTASAAFSGNRILFSSLDSAPLRPAKIMWCLGLDEESFPRVELRSSLCAMQKNVDAFPEVSDQDRYCFLEMVMKTREYLFLSYERVDSKDFKEKGPSLLIEELISYVQKRGVAAGIQTLSHPAFSFDALYFSSEFPVKKWSLSDHAAAQAYYAPRQVREPFFSKSSSAIPSVVTVAQLKKCARHPLQLYFNETVGLYLKEEEDVEGADFVFSSLDKGLFRKESLQTASKKLLHRARAQGRLPVGGFGEAALCDLEEEAGKMEASLSRFSLSFEAVRSVHFVDCLTEESSLRQHPSLHFSLDEGCSVTLQGELEGVTEQGLLFYGSNDFADLIKAWPLYLLYLQLYPDKQTLFLAKDGEKRDWKVAHPEEALKAYLKFYLQALKRPCPFMPSFASDFLEGDAASLQMSLEKETEDLYWNYVKRRGAITELVNLNAMTPQIKEMLQLMKEGL